MNGIIIEGGAILVSGWTNGCQVPLAVFEVELSAHLFVDTCQEYQRSYPGNTEWLRIRGPNAGPVTAGELMEWREFLEDWRRAHPAGYQGSFCTDFAAIILPYIALKTK